MKIIHRSTHRGCENGFTLVELLLTLTMLGILMGIATQLLVAVMQSADRTKVGYAEQLAISRLERTLRVDSLVANAWSGVPLRTFYLADDIEIRYTPRGPWIIREVCKQQETLSRDQFRLPDGVKLNWPKSAITGGLITWELSESAEPAANGRKENIAWRVVTGVGLIDSRWSISEVK